MEQHGICHKLSPEHMATEISNDLRDVKNEMKTYPGGLASEPVRFMMTLHKRNTATHTEALPNFFINGTSEKKMIGGFNFYSLGATQKIIYGGILHFQIDTRHLIIQRFN
ncbi:hypothetical protein ACJX0J_008594 [Zea mays]